MDGLPYVGHCRPASHTAVFDRKSAQPRASASPLPTDIVGEVTDTDETPAQTETDSVTNETPDTADEITLDTSLTPSDPSDENSGANSADGTTAPEYVGGPVGGDDTSAGDGPKPPVSDVVNDPDPVPEPTPEPNGETPAPDPEEPKKTVKLLDVLAALWGIGVAVMLVYTAVSYFRVSRGLDEAMKTESGVLICDRIQTPFILDYKKPAFWIMIVAVAAIVVLAVCLLTDPVTDDDGDDTAVPSDTTETAPPETDETDYTTAVDTTADETDPPKTDVPPETDVSPYVIDKTVTVKPTVIYNKDGLKVTATELKFGEDSATLYLEYEGNSAFNTYSSITVNGYVIPNALPLDTGMAGSYDVVISYKDLALLGITKIAKIGIPFGFCDETYAHSRMDGSAEVKTSAYGEYDPNENTYRTALADETLQSTFGRELVFFTEGVICKSRHIKILSGAVIKEDGKEKLLLEMKNTSDDVVQMMAGAVLVNGLNVDGDVSRGTPLNPGEISIVEVKLYCGYCSELNDLFGVGRATSVELSLRLSTYGKSGESRKGLPGHKLGIVEVSLYDPNATYSYDSEGAVCFDSDGIRVVYKGDCEASLGNSAEIHFLVENNTEKAFTQYSHVAITAKINGIEVSMAEILTDLKSRRAGILTLCFTYGEFEKLGISSVDDIETVEFTLQLKDQNGEMHGIDVCLITLEDALRSIDGVLDVKDGVIMIDAAGEKMGEYCYMMTDIFSCVREYPLKEQEKIKTLRVGDATITLSQNPSGFGNDIIFGVASVEANGQTVKPIRLNGEPFELDQVFDLSTKAFWADGCFVVSNGDEGNGRVTYILYDGGCEIVSSEGQDTVITLFEEDGKLIFMEKACKFFGGREQWGGIFEECVSRDEIFARYGTARIVNGKLTLTAERIVTIGEEYDLDDIWVTYCINASVDSSEITLDEYLAENAKKYERATPYGE